MKGSHTMSVTVDSDKRKVGNPEWNFVLPYNEARLIVKKYKFKSMREYTEWVRENKPYGLSTNPYQVYTRRGEWIGTAHYLGKIESVVQEDQNVHEEKPVKFWKISNIIKQIFGLGF
jgi:hypothetical protein